jgi:hypothetical protein
MLSAVVFMGGLLAIRVLPSPVISNLGSMNPLDQDDEEVQDIIAAINS